MAGIPRHVVRNAPYSATMVTETTQVLSDGNRIHHPTTARIYRDSEGRVRNEQSLAGLDSLAPRSDVQQVVFINDPVAGVNYALNLSEKTATKSTWGRGGRRDAKQQAEPDRGMASRGRSGRGPDAAGSNVKTEPLGRKTIAGLAADGTRTTIIIPAGQVGNEQPMRIVSEMWYSPDLQAPVLSKHWDPRAGETVFRLVNISRSEPAAALFLPPPDYRVIESIGDGGRGMAQK
jgi:hypothetical protein